MRHLLVLVGVAALVAGAYWAVMPRTAQVEGRVVLRALDGTEIPAAGARVSCYPAAQVDDALARLLQAAGKSEETGRLELQAARSAWMQATARRDDAARILRVSEAANSADLEICRARHREATADAEDALRRLEFLQAGAGEVADPARFVGTLGAAAGGCSADAQGFFRLGVPVSAEVCFAVVFAGTRDGESDTVWLRRGVFENGDEIHFSNETILTAEQLLAMARSRKRPGSPEGSPAD